MPSKRKHTGSKTLGAELRRRRGSRTLQQISEMSKSPPFAERVEPIGVSTLYMIEEGQTMPTLRSLHTLATVYRIPAQHLFTLLSLERYRKKAPSDVDVGALRETTLEALAASDFELAYAAAQRWEEFAVEPGHRRAATNNKASALWKLGQLDEASLILLELLSDPELPARQAVVAFTNLAEIFRSKGNLRQALVQADAGLAIAEAEGLERARAYLLRTRANVLTDECLWSRPGLNGKAHEAFRSGGSIQAAIEDYEASSRIFTELDFGLEALFNDVSVGQARCLLDEFDEGRATLERCLAEFRQRDHAYGEAAALMELGRAYFDREKDDRAKQLLWQCERIVAAGQFTDLAFTAYYYLMKIEERAEGNPGFFFKKCQRLHPSLESRSPEVAAFESILASAGRGA